MAISKDVTISEIAARANVSIATVSRVINQSGSVTAKVGQLFIYNHSIKYCTCYNKKGCATLTHPFLFAFYLPASIAF